MNNILNLKYNECKSAGPEFDEVLAEFGLGREEFEGISINELSEI